MFFSKIAISILLEAPSREMLKISDYAPHKDALTEAIFFVILHITLQFICKTKGESYGTGN